MGSQFEGKVKVIAIKIQTSFNDHKLQERGSRSLSMIKDHSPTLGGGAKGGGAYRRSKIILFHSLSGAKPTKDQRSFSSTPSSAHCPPSPLSISSTSTLSSRSTTENKKNLSEYFFIIKNKLSKQASIASRRMSETHFHQSYDNRKAFLR